MISVDSASSLRQAVLGVASMVTCHSPTDSAELAAMLAEADQAGLAVVPWGGGSEQRLGAPPARCDLVMETRQLAGIIAYAPEDLTISVRAGTTLAEVDDVLARHGQFLPLDLPHRQRATVGGVLATNAAPLRRLRYGGVRDLVIGVEVALASGAICKAGGRVVKNVAGYDLCKLFVGSLGTLGIITSSNFKVQPLPRVQAVIEGTFASRSAAVSAGSALARVSHGYSAIVASGATDEATCSLGVIAEGFSGTVDTVAATAARTIQAADGDAGVRKGAEEAAAAIHSLTEWRRLEDADRELLLRGAVPPAEVGTAIDLLLTLFETRTLRPAWQADLATGTFFLRVANGGVAEQQLKQAVLDARTAIRPLQGHIVVADGSLALRGAIDTWGGPPAAERLARTLKGQLDPRGTLNPGRYVYGI